MADADKPIEPVSVAALRFDPLNPRLPPSVDSGDENALFSWMLRDATILELMASIGASGYFPGEPLLVTPADEEGYFTVVEGNRRLVAVKLLLDPDRAPVRKKSVAAVASEAREKPKVLPVIKYDTREELLEYLGFRHITGIKEWDPLAKARHLEQLRQTLGIREPDQQHRELAKTIGSRSDYVARLLTGLKVYERIEANDFFGAASQPDEDPVDFGVLTTALSYKHIADFLGLHTNRDPSLAGIDDAHLKELTTWLFKNDADGRTRLGESRNLTELSHVVADPKALDSFRSGRSLLDAYHLTGGPGEVFRENLRKASNHLNTARDYVHLLDDPLQADSDSLLELVKLIRALKSIIDAKLVEAKETEGDGEQH